MGGYELSAMMTQSDKIKGVIVSNATTLGLLTITETQALVEWLLKIALLVLTVGLTARKWYLVEKKAKIKNESETEILNKLD